MADLSIPEGPGAVTPEWLTQALRSTGAITRATVTSRHVEPCGVGKGFGGPLARIGLDYDLAEAGAPASVIGKFPPPGAEVRAAMREYRMFEREICFYRDVAQGISLRTPRMYFSGLDLETGDSVLLLEDLAPAQPLDMLEGCTAEDAASTLRHLAAFHAAWWEHPRLVVMDWLPAFDDTAEADQKLYAQCWEVFIKKVGDLVPEGIVPLGARLRQHVAAVKRYLGRRPQTFLHGDFHLNNLLFDSTPAGRTLTVIDWQACSRGRAMRDLAYFLVTGLRPDTRRAHERDLLKLYHTVLTEQGVETYSFEECLQDYRFTMLEMLYFMVMILSLLDFSTSEVVGRMRDMAIERLSTAILDHNPGELLPE